MTLLAAKAPTPDVSTAGVTAIVSAERMLTDGDVVVAGDVILERTKTDGHIVAVGVVMKERIIPDGHVATAGGVAEEGLDTDRDVARTISIVHKGLITNSAVASTKTGSIGKSLKPNSCAKTELLKADGSGCKAVKRLITHCGVGAGYGVALKGLPANSDVRTHIDSLDVSQSAASGVVLKRASANGGVAGRRVGKKGERSIRSIVGTGDIAQKRPSASRCILVCGIAQERAGSDARAEVAVGEA